MRVHRVQQQALRQLVQRTTLLERRGELQVFKLQEHLRPGELGDLKGSFGQLQDLLLELLHVLAAAPDGLLHLAAGPFRVIELLILALQLLLDLGQGLGGIPAKGLR